MKNVFKNIKRAVIAVANKVADNINDEQLSAIDTEYFNALMRGNGMIY